MTTATPTSGAHLAELALRAQSVECEKLVKLLTDAARIGRRVACCSDPIDLERCVLAGQSVCGFLFGHGLSVSYSDDSDEMRFWIHPNVSGGSSLNRDLSDLIAHPDEEGQFLAIMDEAKLAASRGHWTVQIQHMRLADAVRRRIEAEGVCFVTESSNDSFTLGW